MVTLGVKQHVDAWKHCTRCPLHETSKKIALYRGTLPCILLMVGEAPGRHENVSGIPFDTNALRGRMLSKLTDVADQMHISYVITNVLGCIPWAKGGSSVRSPEHHEISQCYPRLVEMIKLADPYIVLSFGGTAQDVVSPLVRNLNLLNPSRCIEHYYLSHPTTIIRRNTQTAINDWISEFRGILTSWTEK